jgi:hypothetical protein
MQMPDGKTRWLPCNNFTTESLFVLHAALQKYHQDETQMEILAGMEEDNVT